MIPESTNLKKDKGTNWIGEHLYVNYCSWHSIYRKYQRSKMAPRDRDPDAFPMPSSWLDEEGEDEENEEHTVGNQEERR